jgi:hypothetical protein
MEIEKGAGGGGSINDCHLCHQLIVGDTILVDCLSFVLSYLSVRLIIWMISHLSNEFIVQHIDL